MLTKKGIILILLSLSWPITCFFQLFEGNTKVYWFLNGEFEWFQWYFYHCFNMISYIFIFIAIWLYINSSMKKDKDIHLMFNALIINQVIDLFHYLLFRRQNDIVIIVQGVIILYTSTKVVVNQYLKK